MSENKNDIAYKRIDKENQESNSDTPFPPDVLNPIFVNEIKLQQPVDRDDHDLSKKPVKLNTEALPFVAIRGIIIVRFIFKGTFI
jgi:hypothetical protein